MFNKVVSDLLTNHSFKQLREKIQVWDWSVVFVGKLTSRPAFFNRGDTMACFHGVGKDQAVSDEFTHRDAHGSAVDEFEVTQIARKTEHEYVYCLCCLRCEGCIIDK